jgi:hypothetical protein
VIFKTAAFNRWSLTAKGPALTVTQTFGVAPLWHGRLRIEGFWPGLAGTSRSQKAIRPNTYAYSRSLIGIIAIRFDSRWRYQALALTLLQASTSFLSVAHRVLPNRWRDLFLEQKFRVEGGGGRPRVCFGYVRSGTIRH